MSYRFYFSSYRLSYILLRPWILLSDLKRAVSTFIQRGLWGYSDYDCWNLDNYLAWWLPQAIRHLQETGHGYPAMLDETTGPEEWKQILSKIADGFEAHNVIDDEFPDTERYKYLKKTETEGLQLFVKYFHNLWD